jgi:epoxyqueuosine reductase
MTFTELIKAEAERLGFTLSGVAPVGPPPHLETYEQWIRVGLHASMDYLASERARERRANPALVQPGALSLLVVAMRYFSPLAIPDGPPGEALGRVAAYAWGDDYHEVIPPRLEELVRILEKALGRSIQSRGYTDTGPILERDFAQTAGIGWIGKNTCLISPRHGSYFLIGETFLDVETEPSPPLTTDHCGTCRRCIEACPTEAIRPDRTIDSGRCISYLTIENKGDIPEAFRSQLGDWIFGCDICQTVCPWNARFAAREGQEALQPRPGVPRPVLREELRLGPQDFNRKFRRSPIRRAKRRGYLRNVAVALGNQADTSTIPDLSQVLDTEPEPLVRKHAAWALGRMRALRARRVLEKALKQDPEPAVRDEIRSALDETAGTAAPDILKK